jgi:hypothetical protein
VPPPFCTIVNTCAPTATAPTLEVLPVFGCTVKLADPGPVPEPATVIHDWFVVADHAQPADVLIAIVPLPPAEAIV